MLGVYSHMFNGFDMMSIGRYDKQNKLYFFITVRTGKNKLLLGKINGSIMTLSSYGKIVSKHISYFNEIHQSIFVEDSVLMPNHIHVVLSMKKSGFEYEPSENELKSFIMETVENFKSLTSHEIERFLREIAIISDDTIDFWHSGCTVKTINSLNDYGKIINHVSKNAQEWQSDKYYPHHLSN